MPPRRVAVLGRRLDLLDHRLLGGGVEAAHLGGVDPSRSPGPGRSVGLRAAPAHLHDVGQRPSIAEVRPAGPWPGAGGDPGRRLPGRGPLEHVAGVGEAVLLHAGEVGVAGPGLGERLLGGRPAPGRHLLRATCRALPLGVADLDGDRRAERAAVAHAADERDARPARSACAGPGRSRGGGGPARRRSSSTVIGSPAGRPSTITTRARPCDSPAVRKRSIARIYRRVPRRPALDYYRL